MLQSFAGGRLLAERYGSERPLVLALHGWRRDRGDFRPLLADGEPALAVDLPGFGMSPPPPEPWGPADYAAFLDAELLSEMAERFVVIGHSYGGRVALHLAARRADRVAGAVVAGAPFFPPPGAAAKPALGYRLVRSLARSGLVSDRRLEAARRRHGSADYRAAEGVMRAVLVKSLAERDDAVLAAVSCPVELVWGADDTAAPVSVAEQAAAALRDARLEVLVGVDHFVPQRAPEALRGALERLEARRR